MALLLFLLLRADAKFSRHWRGSPCKSTNPRFGRGRNEGPSKRPHGKRGQDRLSSGRERDLPTQCFTHPLCLISFFFSHSYYFCFCFIDCLHIYSLLTLESFQNQKSSESSHSGFAPSGGSSWVTCPPPPASGTPSHSACPQLSHPFISSPRLLLPPAVGGFSIQPNRQEAQCHSQPLPTRIIVSPTGPPPARLLLSCPSPIYLPHSRGLLTGLLPPDAPPLTHFTLAIEATISTWNCERESL